MDGFLKKHLKSNLLCYFNLNFNDFKLAKKNCNQDIVFYKEFDGDFICFIRFRIIANRDYIIPEFGWTSYNLFPSNDVYMLKLKKTIDKSYFYKEDILCLTPKEIFLKGVNEFYLDRPSISLKRANEILKKQGYNDIFEKLSISNVYSRYFNKLSNFKYAFPNELNSDDADYMLENIIISIKNLVSKEIIPYLDNIYYQRTAS